MPELPEVETLRRGLIPVMEGHYILDVALRRPDLRFPFPANFVSRLVGRRIISLGRRSKYLLVELDDENVLVIHLGMSGSLRIDDSTSDSRYHRHARDSSHDHVIFGLSPPRSKRKVVSHIIYNDPRRFGYMDIVEKATMNDHPFFSSLGFEPLGNDFTPEGLALRWRGVRSNLKSALLNQHHIAGLGNIYVCEALWRSNLSPRRRAGSLVTRSGAPTPRLTSLTEHIRSVLHDALESGGSSLRDYADAEGALGYFQHKFSVYDREGEPCPRPDCSGIVRRITQSGRSTFFCSHCQR